MNLNNITLSLFDILGYLLPGYVVLVAISLGESTFLESDLLSFLNIHNNLIIFSVVAYFFGQMCHTVASEIQNRNPKLFRASSYGLSNGLYRKVRRAAEEKYDLKIDNADNVHKRELFLLADAYVVTAGDVQERNSLQAREGFSKTSMAAFSLLFLVLITAWLFKGGVTLRTDPSIDTAISAFSTLLFAGLALLSTVLFWRRFLFFNRLKVNSIQLLFFAHTRLNMKQQEKAEDKISEGN